MAARIGYRYWRYLARIHVDNLPSNTRLARAINALNLKLRRTRQRTCNRRELAKATKAAILVPSRVAAKSVAVRRKAAVRLVGVIPASPIPAVVDDQVDRCLCRIIQEGLDSAGLTIQYHFRARLFAARERR